MEIVFIIARVIFGLYFVYSGVNHFIGLEASTGYAQYKKIPAAKYAVILSGLMLIAGGLGFVLWQFVCWAAILLVVFLLVTAFIMHDFWNMEGDAVMGERINFMKNIALAAAVAMIAIMSTGIGIM